ncbi:serine hydrolase [Emticicia oligotrophica]|uniref:serine hydrolase domain-containing protein n=1 Tax=Emticicia oligotrophica TaxID=312279 RepID=UPI00273CDF08|nr:serine hydrolase domain-containing protein [Emticicia oligotrophica]
MKKIILFCLLTHMTVAQSLQNSLDSLLAKRFPSNSAGIAVMIIKNNKVLYKKAFGLANLELQTPLTPKSNLRMASVSKQFTAMCILLLEKQGKLSFEDNLLKFFPDFNQAVGSKIKIKHLLTHTSGIIDYEELIPENQKNQILDKDVVDFIKNQSKIYFEAGSKFQYSNSGFCLLEQIVEKVSGIGFNVFIENNIFQPLKMNNSTIYQDEKTISNRAMGYAFNKENKLVFSDQSITSATKGDGCIYTSLEDYQKWIFAIEKNQLVNLNQSLKRVNYQIKPSKVRYGLGWFHTLDSKNILELYHTGSTCGFSNSVSIIPQKGFALVCFSNIANNHEVEKDIRAIIEKSGLNESKVNFQALLNLTR